MHSKTGQRSVKITNLILTDRDMLEGRDIAMQKVRKIVKMCVFFLVSLDEFYLHSKFPILSEQNVCILHRKLPKKRWRI